MKEITCNLNELKVTYNERPDVGKDFLTFDIEGWDDVKKICKKVLTYEGRKFTYCSWNSDYNYCNFSAPHNGSSAVATIS